MSAEGATEIAFDQHSTEYAQNGVAIEAGLRERCPVAWSTNHGGFWTVTSHSAVSAALRDRELCSSAKQIDENGQATGGVQIPPNPGFRLLPDESDPPDWDTYRKVLNRPFAPAAIAARKQKIVAYATEVINKVIEQGEADVVTDISSPVTALITLDILDLPLTDWPFYARPIHRLTFAGFEPEVQAQLAQIYTRLGEVVAAHRADPGDTLIDHIMNTELGGEKLADRIVVDIILQLLVGGFNTTSGLIASALVYLAEHRELQATLLDSDETALRIATEEFVRWVSPVNAVGRTAFQNMSLDGQEVEAGDRLWFMYRSANRDAAMFANPDEVDLTRMPNRHLGFGTGIHRCLGSNLARQVFQVVLLEVLRRMPDYEVHDARPYPRKPSGNGWVSVPVRFTPGRVEPSGIEGLI